MSCCDANGNCNQGRNCPVRADRTPQPTQAITGMGDGAEGDIWIPLSKFELLEIAVILFLAFACIFAALAFTLGLHVNEITGFVNGLAHFVSGL